METIWVSKKQRKENILLKQLMKKKQAEFIAEMFRAMEEEKKEEQELKEWNIMTQNIAIEKKQKKIKNKQIAEQQ